MAVFNFISWRLGSPHYNIKVEGSQGPGNEIENDHKILKEALGALRLAVSLSKANQPGLQACSLPCWRQLPAHQCGYSVWLPHPCMWTCGGRGAWLLTCRVCAGPTLNPKP